MREKLIELIKQLDPDLQEIVIEVIEKERDYLDYQKPKGIKDEIRDIIDRYAKFGSINGDGK